MPAALKWASSTTVYSMPAAARLEARPGSQTRSASQAPRTSHPNRFWRNPVIRSICPVRSRSGSIGRIGS